MLREKMRCATAESCTGGGIATAITALSGSSAWFDRGFVTYSNEAKQEMLGVKASTLSLNGAVSAETVTEMAEGAILKSAANVSVAVSGIAGPDGGTKEKPVGTVWIAWAGGMIATRAERFSFEGDRESVREQTIQQALLGLCERLTLIEKQKKEGRYFFALCPNEHTREKLFQAASQVVDEQRLTPSENLHMTLAYLGHIPTDFIERAVKACQKIEAKPFYINIDGVNDWPKQAIRYLSISEVPEALLNLVTDVNGSLSKEGYKPARRPYVPHITVARQSMDNALPPIIQSIPWQVKSFCLLRAHAENKKNKYEVVEKFSL
jgi:nicotinamide-nucleotide amidase